MKLKDLFVKELTKKEIALLPAGFDTVGDIIIFNNFPKELEKKEKLIGNKILEHFRHIKVVAKKTGMYSGKYRTPKIKIIAGEKRKETLHKENNIRLKLNVEKTYFSERTATERLRAAKLVKPKQDVLVMFSGIGPFPLVISRNSKAREIYGVEINPIAHKYALENVELNKVKNVKLFKGDVNTILPKVKKRFDHVFMPLPKDSGSFLGLALKKVKKGGFVHMYSFARREEIKEKKDEIMKKCPKCRIQKVIECGQLGPGKFRLCFDIKIS